MKRLSMVCVLLLLIACISLAEEEVILPQWQPSQETQWLLDIARGELGYTEGPHGYSKYGEWAGDPYAQWCAEFVCWCVNEVDNQHGTQMLDCVYPKYSGQNTGKNWFIRAGRYVTRSGYLEGWGYQWYRDADAFLKNGEYIPQPGDWVFFTFTSDTDTDHVAMVEYCSRDENGKVTVHVIEGNAPVSVQRAEYALLDPHILGYGTVNDVVDVTLKYGYNGEKVRQLQHKLVQLGFLASDKTTGTFGGDTKQAVRDFQLSHGLKVNSVANRQTQQAIDLALEQQFFQTPSNWIVDEEE